MENYTLFSLGTNCTLSFNLKRFNMQKENGLLDDFITSYSSMLWLFERKFSFVDKCFGDYLELIPLGGNDTIIHRPSGLILHHAFPRNGDGFIVENWRDYIKEAYSKYKFLSERMNNSILTKKNPCFVIHAEAIYGEQQRDTLCDYQFKISQSPNIMRNIIIQSRISYGIHLKFALLSVRNNTLQSLSDLSGVYIDDISYAAGDWWEGNPMHYGGCQKGWREGLERLETALNSNQLSFAEATF